MSLRDRQHFSFRHIGLDLAGGATTAVVSLPLALAFGVASGAGPQAGLYGAVIVGLFASVFGSSSRLISEPTGPMTVMMTAVITSLIADHPDQGLAMAFTVVMVAGLFQILLGVLKLGEFITVMPYSVISGFMSGIGIILIVLQLPPFLGQDAPGGGVVGVLSAMPALVQDVRMPELALGGAALAVLLIYPVSWRRFFPPQLLVLLAATAASLFLPEADTIRRIGEIPVGWPALQVPTFTGTEMTRIMLDGLVLGTLGAIDTVLTAMIADSLTREYHDSNRELIGQGIGNLVSGLCGGLPGAGATMGTVVNIQTGARSAWSGVFRALLLLIVVLGAAPLTSPIPMSVLAAIALKVGLDILDWSFLKRIHRVSVIGAGIMYGVLLLTVFVDLIVAVGVGVFVANLLTIQRLSKLHAQNVGVISMPDGGVRLRPEEQTLLERAHDRVLLFYLSGPMIFGVAKAIARQHAAIQLQQARVVIVDLHDVPLLGVTVSLALENMVLDAIGVGVRVMFAGAQGPARKRLERLGLFNRNEVSDFPDRTAALQAAVEWLETQEPAGQPTPQPATAEESTS